MNMMKAVRIHRLGGPEVLQYEDAPRPEPAQGEVLVRVHAASINPADWKTRAGFQPTRQPLNLPRNQSAWIILTRRLFLWSLSPPGKHSSRSLTCKKVKR